MYNPYGSSGYKPTYHSRKKPSQKSGRKSFKLNLNFLKDDFLKKLIVLGVLVFGTLFFAVWLFLGDFRFMMWRYPSLSGFPFGSRDYVVLFQNNYELRPTGGFISAYGVMHFSHGFYTGMDVYDVYGQVDNHEDVDLPLVISALMEDDVDATYTFRDANYDPDFTIGAEELIRFYQMTNSDAEVDGVIAADLTFLEWTLEKYQPLYAEGYTLTDQNVFETLTKVFAYADKEDAAETVKFANLTDELASSIIKKTLILPWRIGGMLDLLAQGFEEKHVIAAFQRNGIANSFASRGWDGSLPKSDSGDFLVINEANYSNISSNRYISRSVEYELEVTDEKDILGNPVINATVQVTISHDGAWEYPLSGNYSAYLRTMIPLGSDVTQGASITEEREDSDVLGELVELAPGETVSYTYSYELPEYVWVDGAYELRLHKQPGTLEDHYRIVVHAPDGYTMEGSGFNVKESLGIYEVNLKEDVQLSFSLLAREDLEIIQEEAEPELDSELEPELEELPADESVEPEAAAEPVEEPELEPETEPAPEELPEEMNA